MSVRLRGSGRRWNTVAGRGLCAEARASASELRADSSIFLNRLEFGCPQLQGWFPARVLYNQPWREAVLAADGKEVFEESPTQPAAAF